MKKYLNCPKCGSNEFSLVIERQWAFRVKDIGLNDVTPAHPPHDEWGAKSLICDSCEWNGWIEDYFFERDNVVLTLLEDTDSEED